jgi:putative DNA primase/helicase
MTSNQLNGNRPTPIAALDTNGDNLQSQHRAEFKASKIDPELINLNIRSVDLSWATDYRGGEESENDDIPFILENLNWTVTRLNSGRLNDNTLKKVQKMDGGWYILPFYGLAERAEINYFRFKPDNPTSQWSNGKVSTNKYIGAVGESPRAYCPNISEALWAVIACRYGVEKTGNNFWEWLLEHPEIHVIITEGEKKALSGLSAGYVVISLPGIDCGYTSSSEHDDGSVRQLALIPDLQALAQGERTIYIAFDRDSNPQTVKRVQKARQKLARLFGELGCKTLSVKWDEKYKGLDDFVFGAGQEALEQAIESAQDISVKIEEKDGKKKESIPSALEMSKKVFCDLLDNTIRFDASVKQYWRYDGKGKWVQCSDEYVFGIVQEYLEEAVTTFYPSYVRNVIEFAKKDFLHEEWTEASNLLYIPFTNGVLELKTSKLLPHSPDYGFTWQLPRLYSAIAASWEKIDRFLDELTNKNQQLKDIAIAFCNAVLTGRSDLQKFLYLFGSGGNGKGVFANLLEMLVGKENTHSTTIKDLNENRFEAANLKGKRLIRMNDEDKRVGGLSVFKSATGGDPIRYERKGKDANNFVFKGIMVVAANNPTFVGDSNYAIKRRKVDFPCLFRPSKRRNLTPEFEADLTAFTTYLLSIPNEWVTDTINGADNVEAVKQLNWEMTVREDSIAAFFSDKLIVDPKGSIACGALYSLYQSYCDDSGLKAKSINNFTPSLIELCNDSLGHSITRQHTKTGKVINGLRRREEWEFEAMVTGVTAGDDLVTTSKPSPSIEGDGRDPSFNLGQKNELFSRTEERVITNSTGENHSSVLEKNQLFEGESEKPSQPSPPSPMAQDNDSSPSPEPSPAVTSRHQPSPLPQTPITKDDEVILATTKVEGAPELGADVLKVGDRVCFSGTYQDWGIEPETVLTVVEIGEEWVKVHTDDRRPISLPSNFLALAD